MPSIYDTKYFTEQPNLLPSFSSYYAGLSSSTGLGGLLFQPTIVTTINGLPTILFFICKMQAISGALVTTPVVNREIILQKQLDGSFADVTSKLLGTATSAVTGFSLNGQAADVVVTNINGSSNPIIIISTDGEDGRTDSGVNTAYGAATAQVQIPQSDGTYKTINIGSPEWGGKGSIQVVNTANGTEIFLGCFYTAQENQTYSISANMGTSSTPYYQYDANLQSFTEIGRAPSNAYGYIMLSPTSMVTMGYYYPTPTSTWPNVDHAFGIATEATNGTWSFVSHTIPVSTTNINNYVAWNGDLSPTPIASFNGVMIGQAFLSILGTIPSPTGLMPVIITTIEGSLLATPRADGNYYQIDGSSYMHFQFWNVVNNALVQSSMHIIGENTAVSAGGEGFQFLDLNHNGLTDFIVNNPNSLYGRPDVYLNDGAGDLYHVDPSALPSDKIGSSTIGSFADLNGDGVYDLIYNPWSVSSLSNSQPMIFYGTHNLTITQNITIGDRNAGVNIITWSGNDIISDVNANSTTSIDAGLGINTCTYSNSRSQYQITHNTSGTWSVIKNGQIDDTLTNVERLQFTDSKLALDLDGNAGITALILGAVFGSESVSNKDFVGIGLSCLDAGMSGENLMLLALNAKLGSGFSNTAEVNLLYQNLVGVLPSAADLNYLVGKVNSGQYTQLSLAVMAAELDLNASNIHFVGLHQTGIEYSL